MKKRVMIYLVFGLSVFFSLSYAAEPGYLTKSDLDKIDFYPMMGRVGFIDKDRIIINDMSFRLSPTLKVILPNKKTGKLGDVTLKKLVGLKTIKLSKRTLVDTIYILK